MTQNPRTRTGSSEHAVSLYTHQPAFHCFYESDCRQRVHLSFRARRVLKVHMLGPNNISFLCKMKQYPIEKIHTVSFDGSLGYIATLSKKPNPKRPRFQFL